MPTTLPLLVPRPDHENRAPPPIRLLRQFDHEIEVGLIGS
jgi:hypothetical protein